MTGQPGRFRMDEGDWVCSDAECGNVNFARRTQCNRCGKEKSDIPKKLKLGTEIGKVAAEKSGGLFSADDWQCSKCGNVNWARRQQCNMCNAPKFGEVEERTGYGGGYNERENVEYVERDDSDGEFDEYGRKKKKFRGKEGDGPTESKPRDIIKQVQVPKAVQAEEEEEEDEDDEEEDDDDGDLSKYDLSGWGDEDNVETAKATNHTKDDKKASRSRSRSRSPSSKSSSSRSGTAKKSRSRSPSSRSGSSSTRHRRSKRSRSRSRSYDSKSRSRRRSRSASRDRFRSKSRSRSPYRRRR